LILIPSILDLTWYNAVFFDWFFNVKCCTALFPIEMQPKSISFIFGTNFGCGTDPVHLIWISFPFSIWQVNISSSFLYASSDGFYITCTELNVFDFTIPLLGFTSNTGLSVNMKL